MQIYYTEMRPPREVSYTNVGSKGWSIEEPITREWYVMVMER